MLKVVCVKWGDKYPAEYVNRLHNMVKRNLSQPYEFICTTEDGEGLDHSLKALAEVHEARGDVEKADALRMQAVMVMGHCLEDKMNGMRPCPVREADLRLNLQAGG